MQRRYLCRLIDQNRNTSLGQQYGFDRIKSVEEFQAKVPLCDYEAMRPWIERVKAGEKGVLTADDVILLEPTGGTNSGTKLIPYTKQLRREFQCAVYPWLDDLYRAYPALSKGRSYWSISPALKNSRPKISEGGVPIGFENDAQYLGFLGRIYERMFAVPSFVRTIEDIYQFRYVTNFFLLATQHLSLISVWNPTFLTLLLDQLQTDLGSLIRDIHDGVIRAGDIAIPTKIRRDPARARAIEQALGDDDAAFYQKVWPELTLVSCWTNWLAQEQVGEIKRRLAHALIQPKGLLATEGVISLPLVAADGAVIAYNSHFYEFIQQEGGQQKIYLLADLKPGESYEVVITTGGGLYRYRLYDRIYVKSLYQGLPVIEFCGRAKVCDVAGEKLQEQHVERAVADTLKKLDVGVRFMLFAPQIEGGKAHYVLYLEPFDTHDVERSSLQALIGEIECVLCENFHYEYARRLEQLAAVRVFLIERDGVSSFQKRCIEEAGQRIGDIKNVLLDYRSDWSKYFVGKEHRHETLL